MDAEWNCPAATFSEHTDCCHSHGAEAFLKPEWIPENEEIEDIPNKTRQACKPQRTELPRFFGPSLHFANCIVNINNGSLVGSADEVRQSHLTPFHLDLNDHVDIDIVEKNETVAPVAIGMHHLVRIYGL